jgi:FdhE protein
MIFMTQDVWLVKHPYLQRVADLQARIDAALAEVPIPSACAPSWDDYISDFHAGIPLLLSPKVAIDFRDLERPLRSLVEALALKPLPGKLAQDTRALEAQLHADPDSPRRALSWLFDHDSFTPKNPGLLRYLGWSLSARYLGPVVDAFSDWRDEERWLHPYCPTCGALAAMAQLVGADPGRLRFLWCGCCRSRWRYRRTGCPFCQSEDDHRLAVVAVEGESGLRIDYCEACRGYVKTYEGEGNESVLLADWTSLHLDIIARDRGLNRCAGSLYQL